ncbi:hypothetical protein L596_005142 [Steinernema carpocapsae]|uniref:Plastocyanin-like domain-containing protein n=1 Tax=Steinernema carpocapsae TaxID=34508 RepID=A0A4U8UY06_STECR|nr:hypothetical protein L596_005142 [Steinernema carpocapsae]
MNRDIPCANENTSCNKLVWSNKAWLMGNIKGMSTTPSSRDTVVVPVGGYVTLRFKTTNPGWWFAHCHLMLHNMGGTAFAFRVGDPNQVPSPPAAFPHTCGDYEPSSAPKPYMPTPPTTENTKSSPESIGSLNFIFTAAFFAILNALYL